MCRRFQSHDFTGDEKHLEHKVTASNVTTCRFQYSAIRKCVIWSSDLVVFTNNNDLSYRNKSFSHTTHIRMSSIYTNVEYGQGIIFLVQPLFRISSATDNTHVSTTPNINIEIAPQQNRIANNARDQVNNNSHMYNLHMAHLDWPYTGQISNYLYRPRGRHPALACTRQRRYISPFQSILIYILGQG